MPIPDFSPEGDLPIGVHTATLSEVAERLGSSTVRRNDLYRRLARMHSAARSTGCVRRFVVFGSFVTNKIEPNDADVFLLMENSFDLSTVKGEARLLFDHSTAQSYFGASVFWLRLLAAPDGETAVVESWQVKRDGRRRGIVEIVEGTV